MHDRGNCVIYDNKIFRQAFHAINAGVQVLAVISVAVCYVISRTRKFPEEEEVVDDADPMELLHQEQQNEQQHLSQGPLNSSTLHETDF